ncbi:ABC transporter ATP-binding protein [Cumulibacter soli]|uniref:ABC transporter ATP-binding protein n=1 Tax=Cumulibacter soli TaxID=2546344 RepID=UPI00106828C5|nr:ABC transporter ATP-binding protein [Cumulibacter soli]
MSDVHATGLSTQNLTVQYGGVVANSDINLSVDIGQVVGLIGPNGAGKTTFVDAITGFTPCNGEILLGGRRLNDVPPHRRRELGLSRTWQAGELFGNLTVAENLLVAARPVGFRSLWRDLFARSSKADTEIVDKAIADVGLGSVRRSLARDLTLGQQKLVGVARALVGACSVALLDEPAAGLDTHESAEFAPRLRSIAERGRGVLLIDHDTSLVLDVCDVVYVLEFGKIIFSGSPDQARNDPAVLEAYLGVPTEDPS